MNQILNLTNYRMVVTSLTTTGQLIVGTAVLWSLLLPYYPTELLQLLDTFLGAFVLLLSALLVLPYGVIPGVAVLLAVALTFVERNRRKIQTTIVKKTPSLNILDTQLMPAPPMSPEEVHPDFESPQEEEEVFMPTEDSTDRFTRVDESMDEKPLNATVPSNNNAVARILVNSSLAKTTLE